MVDGTLIVIFNNARPKLMGLAYRILGSVSEAEDAVQDTYLKWQAADHVAIRTPIAWLTTICTRRCIDMLRSAHKVRVDYIGTWLPEPLHTPSGDTPETKQDLASSLSTAFLLMLERLTPKERAAYLLREIFGTSYRDVAETLEIAESACRKLVSRARRHVESSNVRHSTPAKSQQKLLLAFQAAVTSGQTDYLASLLAKDVELRADSGGKAKSISKVLTDTGHILKFIRTVIFPNWADSEIVPAKINGQQGFKISQGGKIHTVVSFGFDAVGAVTDIYLARNPEKLQYVNTADTISLH